MAWGIAPSGNLVVARSEDYTVKILSPRLQILKEFRHPGKRVPLTDNDKKTYFEGMAGNWDGTFKIGAPTFIRNKTEFPKFKPYFKRMYLDDEGYMLFETYESRSNGMIFDVFDPDGLFVNQVILPEYDRYCVIALGFVYQLDGSEGGAVLVKRYELK